MKKCELPVLISALPYASSANAQNTFPSTGPVGIGTTNPKALLQVNGGAYAFDLGGANLIPWASDMAMVGIVPTKVSTENGAIHPGDLLVSSSTLGYAMKGTDRSPMLGAAMRSLESVTGVIEVIVTLQ